MIRSIEIYGFVFLVATIIAIVIKSAISKKRSEE
jgi:hypothetical protein